MIRNEREIQAEAVSLNQSDEPQQELDQAEDDRLLLMERGHKQGLVQMWVCKI